MSASSRAGGLVIAIDGPSGAGKSTAARTLADRLGYVFIDTGAMYRALALAATRAGIGWDDEAALGQLASTLKIELAEGGRGIRLDEEDVSAAIRSGEVSRGASQVSQHRLVRQEMVSRQRELGREGGVVLDGRDIGSAVFPDAELKCFLDAEVGRRAERRCAEIEATTGRSADLAIIERDIGERDHADTTRADSPLTRVADAVLIDSTELSPDEVVSRLLAEVRDRLG